MRRLLAIGYSDEMAREAVAHKTFWNVGAWYSLFSQTFDHTFTQNWQDCDASAYLAITNKVSAIIAMIQKIYTVVGTPSWWELQFKAGAKVGQITNMHYQLGMVSGGYEYDKMIIPVEDTKHFQWRIVRSLLPGVHVATVQALGCGYFE